MTINLKIEIIKIFSLEFNLSSNKDIPFKREKKDEKESAPASSDTKQPSKS